MRLKFFAKTALIFILLLQSACFYRKTVIDSDMIVKEPTKSEKSNEKASKIFISGNYKKGELLQSVLSQIHAGTYSANNFATDSFDEHAQLELRKKLFDENYKIFLEQNSRDIDYILKVTCTEYVPVVQDKDDKSNIPTAQAASLITMVGTNIASVAPMLGPVAGGLSALGPLSGISLGSTEKNINSLISFDVQVLKPSGEMVLSKAYRSTFTTKVVTKGNIATSNSKAVASSSISDAIRSAMDLALVDLKKVLE